MDMDIDTTAPAITRTKPTSSATTTTPTVLTRLCDTQAESFYIYLTVEMEPQGPSQPSGNQQHQLSILTFRKMLSSAVQDLFGSAMGGGINIDILGFWTTASQDPYNRLLLSPTSNIPASSTEGKDITKVTVTPTYSPTTAASSVLRCHSLDVNQLWNSLTLFNTLVDDFEARFEVRYVASTLMGLQANSRQLKWPA
ncbi:hypothetical protein EC957_001891 [Mortierella hygrophila]|uniref:Uncharacterized protein n=1 Tax=Mortierella hygrophila TaxID=979708 RepID=A0A9P6F600_9FUNG|nr:hypothetical protein EC957_001891 [Mortierella hygrophila]